MKLIVDDDDSYDSESNEFKAPFKDNNKMELSEMVEKKKSINAKLALAYN